jgi:hypothetical protein
MTYAVFLQANKYKHGNGTKLQDFICQNERTQNLNLCSSKMNK